jgi:hypothetical protein
MPYGCGRLMTAYGEVYGRGPGWTKLPDIKMLNEMMKTLIRTANLVSNPPLLAPDQGMLQGFLLLPGAINHRAMSSQGNELVKALDLKANLPVTIDLINMVRSAINSAFLVTLFQILVESPQMTATEVLQRAQEKGELLAPMVSRIQSEQNGKIITREIDILSRIGRLPEMPPALIDAKGQYQIVHTSPINQAQKAQDGIAIFRLAEATATMAGFDPGVISSFNAHKALKELSKILAAPADVIRTDEEVSQMNKAQAEKQQISEALSVTDALSNQALTLTKAQQAASLAPEPLLGI